MRRYIIGGLVLISGILGHPSISALRAQEAHSGASSQAAEVSVKIRFLQKGGAGPLRKVEIRLGDRKFFSDPDGWAVVDIPANADELVFVRAGFQTSSLPAQEVRGLSALEVFLYPALGADDEVIVRGRRRPAISKKVISSEEAARVAPGGDPGQVTKLMPGVTTQPGQSEVTIRGSKPADSAYYLDDIKVPFIYHAIGNLSVLPASVVDEVEFSAGGFGPEYGDATGGVVVLRSKNEIPERPKTRFTLNMPLYSSIYHERPLSETSGLLVGTRRSYLELILPKVLPKDSGVTVVPYFRDYQGIYLVKTDHGYDKLSLLASADGLRATAPGDLSTDESGSSRFFVQTYFGAVAYERQRNLEGGWSVTTTPQSVYTDNKFEVSDLKFRVRAQTFRIPIEATKRISRDERFYVGADASYVPYVVTYYGPRFDPDDPFYDVEEAPRDQYDIKGTTYDVSSWIARDFKLPNNGIITPGARAFYFSEIKRVGLDPRFQYRQDVGRGHTIKGAIGQYSQFPRNGEPSKKFGNPRLHFPHARHYILGLETQWDERWSTDIQLFYKDVLSVIRSDAVTNYNNKGRLQSYGAEAFLRRALTERWFGWLSYTWSKTRERKDSETPWYPGDNDQTHVVNLAGSYRMSATWDVGGRLGYHTGDTYTSKLGDAVYNANLEKYQSRAANAINAARLPDYNELSIFSSHDGLFDRWKSTVRWGVEYFWFKRQAYGVQPNYDYSKEEYFKGVPPIPYLEWRGEF
jgi:hypothetical protein